MSSPLYQVSVLSVEDNEAVLKVVVLDQEDGTMPKNATFAAQAIIEAWDIAMHEEFDADSISESAASLKEKAENSPFAKQFARWVTYMYGAEQEISATEYKDIDANFYDEPHRFPRNLTSWREEEGTFIRVLDEDERAIVEISDDQILHCTIRNTEENADGNQQGEMVFTVDDPNILKHLVEGTTWETDRVEF